jgi:twitching motility protein PilT
VRIDGRLRKLQAPSLTPADTEHMVREVLREDLIEEFARTNEADFAYSVPGLGRFRVNAFRSRGSAGMVFRRVSVGAIPLDELGLPPVLTALAMEPRGLVLVTGPTGSGKTTTIAAMIDSINETQAKHIVTIEDPIEVLHGDKRSLVNQREIGSDTEDYAVALKRVLRQDPDVIFIGEMRDPETVGAALTAANTGHLVFSTLHTVNATETVNRIVDFFPPHQQRQARLSLGGSLRGIVSQRLLERVDGKGRIPAVEVLVATGRAFDKIVNPDETHELEQIIAEGEYYGMQTFDQSLFALYNNGLIGLRDALATASHPHDLRIALQQAGLPVGSN